MAEQKRKSQAEKAAKSSRKSTGSSKSKNSNKRSEKDQIQEGGIPTRFISAAVCLILFILFLVIALQPEGVLTRLVESILLGLIGRVAFLISIPALLYLFFIQAFSGNRPVIMRSICVVVVVLLCGCFSHLTMNLNLPVSFSILSELYDSGVNGTGAGVVCGSLAMLIQWLCGDTISYIILSLGIVISLLAAMQITVPSIIRAIKNRPRADWEDEEPIERPEPASIVVNHIATKRIEYIENQRKAKVERENSISVSTANTPDSKKTAEPDQEPANPKVKEILRQIDSDVSTPVAVAGIQVAPSDEEESISPPPVFIPSPVTPENKPEIVPKTMPPLELDSAILPGPQMEIAEPEKPERITAKEAQTSAAQVAQEIEQRQAEEKPEYHFPPIALLRLPSSNAVDGTNEMRENSRRLNETLQSFKIEAHIINVTRGPSVTRYEVELEKGVRLNKLTTAADDIALSLGASGVRIAAVPDKISVVGIEVPNKAVTTVSLREVIDSPEFTKAKSKSSFAVGKDISGNCIVGNIAKLPHMLIAGTTGSGKSVCMNSIIISLLYKASPEDVRLIMVDPKMVELGIYNNIPHLLIPVVTDPKKAAGSLQWAVTEMMRRYRAMSDVGVRDLESYNSIITSQELEGEKLPQVVVIIDELADLMLVAAKEVEESICRIAQMGRAAGIHLIIATQRPSADVITGLMKANIPSRIAFAVASAMESRIILDTQGAEKLVGKGDMLYAPIGCGKPKRVQGCFVSDAEVEAVATYIKENYATTYDQQVMDEIERKAIQTGSGKSAASEPEPNAEELGGDEMLPAAVDVILETGQASVSMLQRRLKLGYARAARIVDEMEEKGIVGPFQGSKPRTILITKEQWAAMKAGTPAQMDFNDLSYSNDDPEEII